MTPTSTSYRQPRFSREEFLEQMYARLQELERKPGIQQCHKAVFSVLRQQLDAYAHQPVRKR